MIEGYGHLVRDATGPWYRMPMLRADRTAVSLAALDFATLIRDGRELVGISQSKLADRAGLSREAVARLEAGHGGLPVRGLQALLAALDAEGVALGTDARPDLRDAPRWATR